MEFEHATLSDLLGDMAEVEVGKHQIVVQVVQKLSQMRFLVADSSGTANLEFEPKAVKMAEKLTEKKTYRMFALEKVNSESLLFKRWSYLKEESQTVVLIASEEKKMFLTTQDLLGKPPKSIIRDPILIKVISVMEARVTEKNGIPFQKVYLADNHHAVYMTFWRQDAAKVSKLLSEGDVVSIRNFDLDNFPDPQYTKNLQPQDFVFRSRTPSTIITKVDKDSIPDHYVDVLDPVKDSSVQGKVKFIDQIYEYKSCPGRKNNCGKVVREGSFFCEKPSCRMPIDNTKLINDYKVTLVVFGLGGIQQVTAFRKALKEFEKKDEEEVEKKLQDLIDVDIDLQLQPNSKDDEDPIVSKIIKL